MASAILDQIVEGMKAFIRQSGGQVPTTIILPWEVAYDLMKLDATELPGLSEELLRRGVLAYNGAALYGMEIRIDNDATEIAMT